MNTHGFRMWGRGLLWAALAVIWSSTLYAGPLFDEGKQLYGEDEYKKAAKVLKISLKEEEDTDESATLLLSDCYTQLKKNYKAISVLRQGAKRHPESWEIYFRLGDLQEKSGEPVRALSAFTQASKLSPDDLTTTFRLGKAYDGMASIEKALDMYRILHKAGSPLAVELLNIIQGMD